MQLSELSVMGYLCGKRVVIIFYCSNKTIIVAIKNSYSMVFIVYNITFLFTAQNGNTRLAVLSAFLSLCRFSWLHMWSLIPLTNNFNPHLVLIVTLFCKYFIIFVFHGFFCCCTQQAKKNEKETNEKKVSEKNL